MMYLKNFRDKFKPKTTNQSLEDIEGLSRVRSGINDIFYIHL